MITIYFGKPRAGKTTVLASIVQQNKRRLWLKHKLGFFGRFVRCYDQVYSNEPTLQDTILVKVADLGKWCMPVNSLVLIDEAGLELSNRDWKSLSPHLKALAALHGHRGVDIVLASQTVDIDISFRQRCHQMYLVSKRAFGRSLIEPISYSIDVDNETHQLIEAYAKPSGLRWLISLLLPGGVRFFRRRRWYKYFDSYVDNYKYPAHGTVDYSLSPPAVVVK